jgi:LacI family transcriptional regulator
MKDVARRAGVAVSSVSRVLNKHPDVSDELRARVTEATKALGYQPDLVAQGLRRGSTSMIGFYVRDISNPLFADIARGAEARLRQAGYGMVLTTNSEGEPERDADYIMLFGQRRVDALMLSLGSESNSETLRALGAVNVPFVLLDRDLPFMEASAVHSDSFTGVCDAVVDLLEQGSAMRVALIAGPRDTRASRERLRGFLAAHETKGVVADERLIRMGSYTTAYGYEQTRQLLDLPEPPNAVVCGGIQLSSGALRAITERLLRIGRDIAFVSCDEVDLMQVFDPPISVVRRDAQLMGELAASLLLDALAGETTRIENMPTEYVRRGTSTLDGVGD